MSQDNVYLEYNQIVIKNKGNNNGTKIEKYFLDVRKATSIVINLKNIEKCKIQDENLRILVEKRYNFGVELLINNEESQANSYRKH